MSFHYSLIVLSVRHREWLISINLFIVPISGQCSLRVIASSVHCHVTIRLFVHVTWKGQSARNTHNKRFLHPLLCYFCVFVTLYILDGGMTLKAVNICAYHTLKWIELLLNWYLFVFISSCPHPYEFGVQTYDCFEAVCHCNMPVMLGIHCTFKDLINNKYLGGCVYNVSSWKCH